MQYGLTSLQVTGKILTIAELAQLVEHTTENCGVHSSILCLGTPAGVTCKTALQPPIYGGHLEGFFMSTITVEHTIVEIQSGAVWQEINLFLIDRQSRGLSPNTIIC